MPQRRPTDLPRRILCVLALGLCAATASAAAPDANDAAGADLRAGERAFRQHCRSCHAVGDNAASRRGPALNGVIGHKAGQVPDFAEYSDANKNSGLIWTEENFTRYIEDPQKVIPGTKKKMPVVKSNETARAIYRYLEQYK